MDSDELRLKYGMYLDSDAVEDLTLPAVDVSDGPSRKDLLGVLRARFGAEPGLAAVRLMTGGLLVGTVPRASVEGGPDTRSGDPGAGLPGYSTKPGQLMARCQVPVCVGVRSLFEFDDEDPPTCPVDPGHGPLKLDQPS